jgi:hypothetical protein
MHSKPAASRSDNVLRYIHDTHFAKVVEMLRSIPWSLVTAATSLVTSGCKPSESRAANDSVAIGSASQTVLVGAWRSKIHFTDGAMGGVTDLEFSYAYNAGGTMTESSNYDEAPNSSPPAYGIWKQVAPGQFQTKYVFYRTRARVAADGPGTVGTWFPDGHGELTETITLAADGASYSSTVRLATFDKNGKPVQGGGTGTGAATRIVF